ncbi:MAG: flagellar basal body rod protein FlgB [Synergistetes bacterium]|nr:flagellar basal body rod protein FlgB [Synergistota bacterium]MDW8193023.1 flagellar basal body rod protein FlgB [Synergistota bacterium]
MFFDKTTRVLEKTLSALSLRQEVIANNIANVNTPEYRRKEVTFEEELKEALSQQPKKLRGYVTHPRHIPIPQPQLTLESVKPEVWERDDLFFRNDKNGVDIDLELAELAKNAMKHAALSRTLTRKFAILDIAIGRR